MKIVQQLKTGILVAITAFGLTACADLSQQQNTAVGAGVGAVTGAVLTDNSAAGVIGGAIVGGVIGHEFVGSNNRYPADQYYYNESDGRYYRRSYQRGHSKVRCNDGVVRRATRNACRYHGGVRYYW